MGCSGVTRAVTPRNAISAGFVAVTKPLPEALQSIGFVTGVAGSMAGIAFCD
jgi:hypothetical protein